MWLHHISTTLTEHFISTLKVISFQGKHKFIDVPLREKRPNTELFWSVFSCIQTEYGDTGKYGPEKTPYLDTFHECSSVSN